MEAQVCEALFVCVDNCEQKHKLNLKLINKIQNYVWQICLHCFPD